ncbi:MAG TPA: peptidoglycan-binding domain-containing protein [Nitrospiraceae bacterium]|nr:peptidoglycan-binding domain-containing protein [Nitrospiraceae bacterium]
MRTRHAIPLLVFLCLPLMLSESCMSSAAEGTGAPPRVSPADGILKGEPAPLSEAEERAVTQQVDALRADPRERRRLIMVAQMLLGRFGYGVGPFDGRFDDKTRRAIKYYQESNKLAATGELDYRTLKQLTDDADWLDQFPLQLPPFVFLDETWDATVSATGTWTLVNGRQVGSLQTTRIECNRQWKYCVESTAVVGESNQLVLNMENNEVERWDDQEIVTKPKVRGCVTDTLHLSRSQKSVTRLRVPTVSEPCRHSDVQNVTLRLESGVKVWTELKKAHKERFHRIMKTGDFRFED